LSRSAHGSDRRKSRGWRERNRRKTKENAETNQGDRSGLRSAKEFGGDRREEKNERQIASEKSAPRQESRMRWIGFPENDGKNCVHPLSGRLMFQRVEDNAFHLGR